MSRVFANRSAKVMIIEESGAARQVLSDVIRSLGFSDVRVVATCTDALAILEVEDIHWIITPMLLSHEVSALSLLQVLSSTPELQQVRTSILFKPEDEAKVNLAFSLGILSCHRRSHERDLLINEFTQLLTYFKTCLWRAPLVSAEYLRLRLDKTSQLTDTISIYRKLLAMFPGHAPLLLRFGEALISAGQLADGLSLINQAGIIDERFIEIGQIVVEKALGTRAFRSEGALFNVLGCQVCVIVDPDSSVLSVVSSLLKSVGVPTVHAFDNGAAAWRWLQKNPEPDLILQEWRLPQVAGPLLLQRIRQLGYVNVPIIVLSSVIKPNELPLLKEMGVDNVVAKPFSKQVFFKNIVWSMQQCHIPTEQKSLERRIRRLLDQGYVKEAERLRADFMEDTRIPTAAKLEIEAEFHYSRGRYRSSRDLAVEALRLGGESLLILNIIGKSLLKVGEYAAALKFFKKANHFSPNNIGHICNMAVSSFEAGLIESSEFLLNKTKDLDPESFIVSEIACCHAIIQGKLAAAGELMAKLRSVVPVIRYMCGRAVALIKRGCYDEGIRLFAETLSSLPEPWTEHHDLLAFNKSLAHARYGEYGKALDQLKPLLAREDCALSGKASVLYERLKQTTASGAALPLFPIDKDIEDENAADDKNVRLMIKDPVDKTSVGDFCLKGIYLLNLTAEQAVLLAHKPVFKKRVATPNREVFHG